jgi:hypothetical protein
LVLFECEYQVVTEAEVIDLMVSSRSDEEWNANCDAVKLLFGGYYPDFWYAAIIRSGCMALTVAGFKSAPYSFRP